MVKLVLLLLIGVASYCLCRPQRVRLFAQEAAQAVHVLVYDKELKFSGLLHVSVKELRKLMPMERSVPWWLARSSRIETDLLQHPLIARAVVRRCGVWSWNCFTVNVRERKAAAIAVVGDQAWVVGGDGGFIAPLKDRESALKFLAQYVGRDAELPLIEGVMLESLAPEVVKARVNYVIRAAGVIEKETRLRVDRIKLRENGETEVRFKGLEVVAVFDLAEGNDAALCEEAGRFRQVLWDFKGREAELLSVDLAFNKIAVVKLVPAEGVKAPAKEK